MNRGKHTCKILKEIRWQIAEKNDIEYITSECHFQGECKGTCPKCEEELRYLENELQKRKHSGKIATIAGISLGLVSSFAAYSTPMPNDTIVEIQDTMDIPVQEEITLALGYGATISKVQPKYPEGNSKQEQFFKQNLKYPQTAKNKGIEGVVVVQFSVEKDGSISDVNVVKGIGGGCDEEVVRVVKLMPKWEPGSFIDQVLKMSTTLFIDFQLDGERISVE